jgi:hypothetical protein
MTLTQTELQVFTEFSIRCNIDLNQAVNYFIKSKNKEGIENLYAVVENIQEIIKLVKS